MTHTSAKSVVLFGATGTIGRATAHALLDAGHRVTCVTRAASKTRDLPQAVEIWPVADAAIEPAQMQRFDAVVSCMASRSGDPQDAWAVDYEKQRTILEAAREADLDHFVLLSAICVQKPLLAFQHAKLAFETLLQDSGLTYSIVRPTAFFKSLSGQVKRVQEGKPFLLFGDGLGTACKPISDRDLGRFLATCLTDRTKHNRILPVGGPGPAITPRDQAAMVFEATGMTPRFKSVPIGLMDAIIRGLKIGGIVVPALRRKAELAKIGRYYATESMLVWDGEKYDADATPSFGSDTLADHYKAIVEGNVVADLGDHAVF